MRGHGLGHRPLNPRYPPLAGGPGLAFGVGLGVVGCQVEVGNGQGVGLGKALAVGLGVLLCAVGVEVA